MQVFISLSHDEKMHVWHGSISPPWFPGQATGHVVAAQSVRSTAAEKPSRGTVQAVGRGKLLENGDVRPLDVKAGDHILFGKYSGSEVKVDGEELIIMREDEIMAVIEK